MKIRYAVTGENSFSLMGLNKVLLLSFLSLWYFKF